MLIANADSVCRRANIWVVGSVGAVLGSTRAECAPVDGEDAGAGVQHGFGGQHARRGDGQSTGAHIRHPQNGYGPA